MKYWDKVLHVFAGGLLVAVFGLWLGVWWGAAACVIAAAGREALNESGWSWQDIVATLTGGVLVLGLGLYTNSF
jgi:hypothetical protein